jgi:hypothetical protein
MPSSARVPAVGRLTRTLVLALAGAAGAAFAAAATLPAALGMDEATGRENLISAIGWGQVPLYWGAEAFKRATPEQRVALVQQTVAWARGFVASPAFAQAYAALRAQNAPQAPEAKGSIDDEIKAQREEQRRQLVEMRASIKQMPPEMRKGMEEVVKQTEAQYAQMNADPQMLAMQKQGLQMQRDGEQQAYAEATAKWQQEWPADGRALVARRLREFLAACKDVDFAAALLPKDPYGKRRFTLTAYEQKPAEWKACYRAGKAPTEAARAAATAWLAELPKG